jgi:hypothetical protein
MTLIQLMETAGLFIGACVAVALVLTGLMAGLGALETSAVLPAVVPATSERLGGRPG